MFRPRGMAHDVHHRRTVAARAVHCTTTLRILMALCATVAFALLNLPPAGAFFISPQTKRFPSNDLVPVLESARWSSLWLVVAKLSRRIAEDSEEGEESDSLYDDNPLPPMNLPADERPDWYQRNELEALKVAQLKQQLRLRGLPVSGRKAALVDRLLDGIAGRRTTTMAASSQFFLSAEEAAARQVQQRARDKKQFSAPNHEQVQQDEHVVDVTEYLDEEDQGKAFKSSEQKTTASPLDDEIVEEEAATTEVWGAQARLGLSDENENRPIVDSLSRTVMEFQGSNQTYVQARVIASKDSLRPFLEGQGRKSVGNNNSNRTTISAEDRLRDIQLRRERETARPIRQDDTIGIDEGDENRLLTDVILNRDFSDWGKYTATGAQLSAQEVQGVLLLTDVYGAFADDTTVLAETIAFECQPIVVMIPDLFRGNPWSGPTDGVNERGQTYEQWRATHSDLRVSVDVRAAAACLRETYGVSSVIVWGTCFGGGRALEAASGWLDSIHDVDGTTVGPPPVDPTVAVAWYPTRYNAKKLFGSNHKGRSTSVADGSKRRMAIIGIFAEEDSIPGATSKDAAHLKSLLEEDDRVVDNIIKVFPGQKHGFAHIGLSKRQEVSADDEIERFVDEEFGGSGRVSVSQGVAEVACLLSTAFMQTYSRTFLPTVGSPISLDDQELEWSKQLSMKDLGQFRDRDVRSEIRDAIDEFVEEPLQSGPRIDPTDKDQEQQLVKLLRSMENPSTKSAFKIEDDDDLATIYGKLTAADENFQIF